MRWSRWLAWGSVVGAAAGYWLARRLQPPLPVLVVEKSVVLITGASSGIGRAYANAFARRGARVVLAARRVEKLEEVHQEIAPYATDVLVVPADVTDSAQLQALVEATLSRFGRIDVLINNAGITTGGPLQTIPQSLLRRTIDLNLASAICLANLCLPSMLVRSAGWIINVASGYGAMAVPFVSAYSASKYGLIAFSNALRRELDGTGIEVISVLPYWTYSEIITPEMEEALIALGEHIDTAEHVAERTIDGLYLGEREIIFGGLTTRANIWVERHFPALMSLIWRARLTPQFIAMSRGGKA
jgi:short-subunit dehydrogenase